MHTATQLIAQRAPPASRTTKAARWQPYYSQLVTCTMSAKSPNFSLSSLTPNISSMQSSLATPILSSDVGRSRPQLPTPTTQPPKESFQRDPSKTKFNSGLIDQTVVLLSDIWHPHNIPTCFLPPINKTGVPSSTPSPLQSVIQALKSKERHLHTSQPPPIASEPCSGGDTPNPALPMLASETDSDQDLAPLRNFVHEVLRRSRTSGSVLQYALCYLEAIRQKVPEILEQENAGIRTCFQPESRIQPATPEELEREIELCAVEEKLDDILSEEYSKTIQVFDSGPEDLNYETLPEPTIEISSAFPSTPFTVLPSPLLCPRRAFLASLILASKFSQDKSYSNRAWAKLSGLPSREIGRCERALGQALQWRLWVGKTPVVQSDAPVVTPSRSVVRSQSESSVNLSKPFLCDVSVSASGSSSGTHSKAGAHMGLRRCSTLPADLPTHPNAQPPSSTILPQQSDIQFAESRPEDQVSSYEKGSPDSTTPGLSYSPSSTDSSDDRTLPLSAIEENIVTTISMCEGNIGKAWLGDSVCHTDSPLAFIGGPCGYESQGLVGVVDVDAATYGPNFYWNADSHIILESGVH